MADCAARTYLIEVSFDVKQDEIERKHLQNLPTSFHLEPEDVDRLRNAAKQILEKSTKFQTFVSDLQ